MITFILLGYIGFVINAPSWFWFLLVTSTLIKVLSVGIKLAEIARK